MSTDPARLREKRTLVTPPPLERHGPARILALCNQKGGVGKTTSTINLGAALAEFGRRVLLVDFDPQGALSVGLGIAPHQLELTTYDLLMRRDVSFDDIVLKTSVAGLDLLPSNIDLSAAEVQLVNEVAREHTLKRALTPVLERYDFVLIDCQPSLGLLTVNALAAAEGVIVPLECEFFSLRGVALLVDTIDKVRDRLNPDLKLEGILATMYDGRTLHSREVYARVVEAFGDEVYDTVIARTVRFPETTVAGQPITSWAPSSNGAQAYRELAMEVLARSSRPDSGPACVMSSTATADPAPKTGFHVRLTNFEGPFDLLLSLIGRRQLDITEIALAQVCDDFIAHINADGPDWDLGQTTQFLVVAATLLDLKAARLLPSTDSDGDEDLALLEARDLLFARLLQYRAYKLSAAHLAELLRRNSRRYVRSGDLEPRFAGLAPEVVLGVDPNRLAELAAHAMRERPVPVVGTDHIHTVRVSVREHMAVLVTRLRAHHSATFRALVADCESTLEVVARFLGLLELYREGSVGFEQAAALSDLVVRWTESDDGPTAADDPAEPSGVDVEEEYG